jgi:hypothetical protein
VHRSIIDLLLGLKNPIRYIPIKCIYRIAYSVCG